MAKRRSLLRSPGVLFIAFTMMLATAGFVYTHWTTTQTLEVQTGAGNLWVQWTEGRTNDDGIDHGDGELTTDEVFDYWGTDSSRDPSSPEWNGERYPKDVGACWFDNMGGENALLSVNNAYPSYHCSFEVDYSYRGSVPARVAASNIEAWVDTDAYCYNDDNGTPGDDTDDFGVRWPGDVAWDDASGMEYADWNYNGMVDDGEPEVWYCQGYQRWPMDLEFTNGSFSMVDPNPFYDSPELTGAWSGPLGSCGMQLDPVNCWWEGEYDPDGDDFDGDGFNEPPGVYQWDGPVNCSDDGSFCWAEFGGYGADGFAIGEDDGGDGYDGDDFEVFQVCDNTGSAAGYVHLEQPAVQGASYSFQVSQEYVNYNEFSYCMCNDGADAYNEVGDWIGTVDYSLPDGADCLVLNP